MKQRTSTKCCEYNGPHPIRCVSGAAVPFPTLKPTEVVTPPATDPAVEEALKRDLQESFRRLIISEEERARFHIIHQQGIALDHVLGEIAAMMDDMFARQRAELEAAEERARRKVFDDNFELALDDLWDEAEKSVVNVQLADVRRSSDNILLRQQDIGSKMEELGRDKIILEEAAERENLKRLLARFNQQVQVLLKKKPAPVADATVRCKVCRRRNCTFFHAPWANHWRHFGHEYLPEELDQYAAKPILRAPSASARRQRVYDGARRKPTPPSEFPTTVLDRRPLRPRVDTMQDAEYVPPTRVTNVAELMAAAKEVEYREYLEDLHRHRIDDKARDPYTDQHAHAPAVKARELAS
jgi:hypothetical protein